MTSGHCGASSTPSSTGRRPSCGRVKGRPRKAGEIFGCLVKHGFGSYDGRTDMDQAKERPNAGNLEEWLAWAKTKVALSLAVSFYMKPPPSAFAEGLLDCYRDYLALCEPSLRWYGSETSGRYREATPQVLRI